jgi:hypothetical protein
MELGSVGQWPLFVHNRGVARTLQVSLHSTVLLVVILYQSFLDKLLKIFDSNSAIAFVMTSSRNGHYIFFRVVSLFVVSSYVNLRLLFALGEEFNKLSGSRRRPGYPRNLESYE